MILFFVLKPLGEGSSDLYFYQIDDFGMNLVGFLTQINVLYASAFLVVRLVALYSFRCVGLFGQVLLPAKKPVVA